MIALDGRSLTLESLVAIADRGEQAAIAPARPRALESAREGIAIEILCACQAIDLIAPLTTSDPLARVHNSVRGTARDPRRRSRAGA